LLVFSQYVFTLLRIKNEEIKRNINNRNSINEDEIINILKN